MRVTSSHPFKRANRNDRWPCTFGGSRRVGSRSRSALTTSALHRPSSGLSMSVNAPPRTAVARTPGPSPRGSVALVIAAATRACTGPTPEISPLARAAREGDAGTIKAMVAAGHDPNGVDPGGNRWTPLLHAIHTAQRPAIDALLATGADVHKKSGDLWPLTMAVGNGQTDVVRRLLAAGASHNVWPGLITNNFVM